MHIKLHEKSHSKEWLGFYDKSDVVLYQRCQYPDGNKCDGKRNAQENIRYHSAIALAADLSWYPCTGIEIERAGLLVPQQS